MPSRAKLSEFAWCGKHITGDEKGQAQNQKVAAKIEKGELVTAPGVSKNYPDAKKLVTEDCIKPIKP